MQEYFLSELLKICNGRDHQQLKDGIYPVYGSGGVMRYVDQYLYDKPSILLPRKGTLDNIQYVDTPFWTVDTSYYTQVDTAKVDIYYLYRYLNLLDLNNLNSGTGVPSMTFDSYYNIKVSLPTLEEQHRISKQLQILDHKISLNRRINATLEKMSKLLYDYWFVQFDFPNEEGKPYKSSGGKMVWNDKLKREIPEGWYCGNLLDVAIFTNGLACQNYRPTSIDRLPVIKISEMHNGFTDATEYVTNYIPESVKVYNGDVLFSWSASLEVMLWAFGNGGLNQHIFKVSSNNGFPRSFYYFQLLEYVGFFKRMADARKTTMGHITQDHLQQSTIVLPPDTTIPNQLEQTLRPIFDTIIKNNEQISTLLSLRNYLLPPLMNGQVTIK